MFPFLGTLRLARKYFCSIAVVRVTLDTSWKVLAIFTEALRPAQRLNAFTGG